LNAYYSFFRCHGTSAVSAVEHRRREWHHWPTWGGTGIRDTSPISATGVPSSTVVEPARIMLAIRVDAGPQASFIGHAGCAVEHGETSNTGVAGPGKQARCGSGKVVGHCRFPRRLESGADTDRSKVAITPRTVAAIDVIGVRQAQRILAHERCVQAEADRARAFVEG